MHDSEIFAALEKVRTSAGALTRAARRLLPQLEGDLQRLGAVCAGDGPGLAFARAFVEELVRPVREVTPALREYMTPLEDSSMDDPDEPPSSGLGAERPLHRLLAAATGIAYHCRTSHIRDLAASLQQAYEAPGGSGWRCIRSQRDAALTSQYRHISRAEPGCRVCPTLPR